MAFLGPWSSDCSGFGSDSHSPHPQSDSCFATSLPDQQPLEVLSVDPLPSQPCLSGFCSLPGDTRGKQAPSLLCADDPGAIYSFPPQPQETLFPVESSNHSRERLRDINLWSSPQKNPHSGTWSVESCTVLLLNVSENQESPDLRAKCQM